MAIAGRGARRSRQSATEPPLLLFGSPMPASGFVILASHFGGPLQQGNFGERIAETYEARSPGRPIRAVVGPLLTTSPV